MRRPLRRLRPRRPASLQARLVMTAVALVTAACAVLGTLSVVTMNHFLIARLDTQLAAAVGRSSAFTPPRPPDDGRDGQGDSPGGKVPAFLLAPGQGEGTLGAFVADGDVVKAAVLNRYGAPVELTSAAAAALLDVPADGVPRTVTMEGLGDYRVAATMNPDKTGVQITGLPLAGVHAIVGTLAAVAAGVGAVVLVVTGLAGMYLTRRTLRPLASVAATARKVTTLPLHSGEVSLPVRVAPEITKDATEVGQVAGALNQLIDHVGQALQARQASETKLRRFVADASHELRTPLAAIRGYAELTRRSRGTTPPEVAGCLDRVEAAALRMTALVEDLLLLARLDAGRPGERSEVDLSELCVENLSDARAAGGDHAWSMRLPADPVTVVGDRARLHQVVANLLANARVHTPAGTHVELSLGLDGDEALLSVADDGPGVPAELMPRVFERFTRGDSSRSRSAGSSGLGLSIVAAVVEAHGGRVGLDSGLGGAVFTVRLPVAPLDDDRRTSMIVAQNFHDRGALIP